MTDSLPHRISGRKAAGEARKKDTKKVQKYKQIDRDGRQINAKKANRQIDSVYVMYFKAPKNKIKLIQGKNYLSLGSVGTGVYYT